MLAEAWESSAEALHQFQVCELCTLSSLREAMRISSHVQHGEMADHFGPGRASTTLLPPVLSQMISSDRNLCGRYSCFQFAVFSPGLKAAVAECSKSARAGLKQVLQPGFVALACEV